LEEVHTDADKIKVILWKGFCSVHQHFKPEHVRRVREKDPQVKVLVHPECSYEVVQAADDCGSTEYIIRQVKHASPGTRWAIGTEVNLVQRLANQYADQKIKLLNEMICPCLTMNRIDLPHLLWSLEQIEAGQAPNRIVVDQEVARLAKVALDRMLALS
jgi:quinolinate synthase